VALVLPHSQQVDIGIVLHRRLIDDLPRLGVHRHRADRGKSLGARRIRDDPVRSARDWLRQDARALRRGEIRYQHIVAQECYLGGPDDGIFGAEQSYPIVNPPDSRLVKTDRDDGIAVHCNAMPVRRRSRTAARGTLRWPAPDSCG